MATASALLLIFSFPKFEFGYLAWVALAPLLTVLAGGVAWRRAFALGWLTGFLFTFCAENWIAHSMMHYGDMGTIAAYAVAALFAAVLALFPALFAAVTAWAVTRFGRRAVALAPVIWAATEWLRPLLTGVTWNALGVSQAQYFTVARMAQFGGVYLVGAVVAAGSAWLVLLLRFKEPGVARAATMMVLCAVVALWTPTQIAPPMQSGLTINVAGVQPNVPVDLPPDEAPRYLERTLALTRDVVERTTDKKIDLIVWAESPLSLFYDHDPATREKLDGAARDGGAYLIVNTVARDGERYFNSVSTISPRPNDPLAAVNPLRRYDKIRLVPFGEYVPWRAVFGRFAPAVTGDFAPGTQAVVNVLRFDTQRALVTSVDDDAAAAPRAIERTTGYLRTGAFICYEAAFPDLVRGFVRNGATLLVNVSEDGWFGNTAGARQHLRHAALRAIENDRDLVRVTNTGITALITAEGRVVDPLPMFAEGTRVWQARTHSRQTFYTQRGDWFAVGCVAATALLLVAGLIRRPNR